jgi:hypothetical protein
MAGGAGISARFSSAGSAGAGANGEPGGGKDTASFSKFSSRSTLCPSARGS